MFTWIIFANMSSGSINLSNKRLLLVHAHPDDETINNGVTMAKYVAAGAKVTLITCTRGEEGEVLVSELAHLASNQTDQLGQERIKELSLAMSKLGVTDHRFLGEPEVVWRDSGMMGSKQNQRSDVFWNADLNVAAQKLLKIILEIKPQVMITYDEIGGYGHPDHIKAHLVAMRAAELADAAGWSIQKIYWNTMPKSVLAQGIAKMKEIGSDFFGTDNVDDLPFAKPDELVTSLVSAPEFVDRKMAAMAAHATQISLDGPFFALSNNLGMSVFADEYYTLVRGNRAAPFDSAGRETDLFAGTF